jgi:hypothetical protein
MTGSLEIKEKCVESKVIGSDGYSQHYFGMGDSQTPYAAHSLSPP